MAGTTVRTVGGGRLATTMMAVAVVRAGDEVIGGTGGGRGGNGTLTRPAETVLSIEMTLQTIEAIEATEAPTVIRTAPLTGAVVVAMAAIVIGGAGGAAAAAAAQI